MEHKLKEYVNFESNGIPKHIIEHFTVGFGVNARDIFVCKEITPSNDIIITAYTTIDESDKYYKYITDTSLDEDEVKELYDMGIDFTSESLYQIVPGSEKYCLKDKKIAGVSSIRSFITEYIYSDIPADVNINNWIEKTDFTDSFELVKNIIKETAEFLNKERSSDEKYSN